MMTEVGSSDDDFIPCGCGCRKLIRRIGKKGKPVRFAPYHFFRLPINKGRKHTEDEKLKIGDSCRGSKHWNYKNGISKHAAGYIRRLSNNSKKDNRILEHRLVWEEYHNACLLSWADVHHKNKIKTDNRIENLQGMMKRDHHSQHKKDMSKRKCSTCGKISTEYYRGSQVWHKHPLDKTKFVCSTCYKKLRRNMKRG